MSQSELASINKPALHDFFIKATEAIRQMPEVVSLELLAREVGLHYCVYMPKKTADNIYYDLFSNIKYFPCREITTFGQSSLVFEAYNPDHGAAAAFNRYLNKIVVFLAPQEIWDKAGVGNTEEKRTACSAAFILHELGHALVTYSSFLQFHIDNIKRRNRKKHKKNPGRLIRLSENTWFLERVKLCSGNPYEEVFCELFALVTAEKVDHPLAVPARSLHINRVAGPDGWIQQPKLWGKVKPNKVFQEMSSIVGQTIEPTSDRHLLDRVNKLSTIKEAAHIAFSPLHKPCLQNRTIEPQVSSP